MLQTCKACGRGFSSVELVDGRSVNLHGRRRCLRCLPHRPRPKARRPAPRPIAIKRCEACGEKFPAKIVIDAKVRSLYRRRFCLTCSPFGIHNRSSVPPRTAVPEELVELRRQRRNAKMYRYQKKRRRRDKAALVEARGGCCADCQYRGPSQAFDFHHRDPSTKEFSLATFSGSRDRLLSEAEKCDLVCANCHRLRHLAERCSAGSAAVVEHRRRTKSRAVAYMGGCCFACDRIGPSTIYDFHHWNAAEKDFAISNDGIPRKWERIVAELAKCVMLCANCHREVHAGVRELDEGLLGLAERAATYVA